MGLAVHPNVTLRKMDQLGENFDEVLKKWIGQICLSLNGKCHIFLIAYIAYSTTSFHLDPSCSLLPPSVQIIMDNLDTNLKASRETSTHKGKSLHWVSLFAVKDRVSGNHLPDQCPLADVSKVPLSTWLPSVSDCVTLRAEFIVLVSRVLVQNLTAFCFLRDQAVEHIPHTYSAKMKKKSEIVSLQ